MKNQRQFPIPSCRSASATIECRLDSCSGQLFLVIGVGGGTERLCLAIEHGVTAALSDPMAALPHGCVMLQLTFVLTGRL